MNVAKLDQRELILFDLDGTLVDSAFDLYRAMNLSLARLNLPLVTEQQVRVWIGKGTSLFCESTLKYLKGEVDPYCISSCLIHFWKFTMPNHV